MLSGNGNDNSIEFTPLRFMNGNSIGKGYFRHIFPLIGNWSLLPEMNQT